MQRNGKQKSQHANARMTKKDPFPFKHVSTRVERSSFGSVSPTGAFKMRLDSERVTRTGRNAFFLLRFPRSVWFARRVRGEYANPR